MNTYKQLIFATLIIVFASREIVKPISEPAAAAMVLGTGTIGAVCAGSIYKDMKEHGAFKTRVKKYVAQGAVVGVALLSMAYGYWIISKDLPSNKAQRLSILVSEFEKLTQNFIEMSLDAVTSDVSCECELENIYNKYIIPTRVVTWDIQNLSEQIVADHSSIAQKIRAYFGKPDLIAFSKESLQKVSEILPSKKAELVTIFCWLKGLIVDKEKTAERVLDYFFSNDNQISSFKVELDLKDYLSKN